MDPVEAFADFYSPRWGQDDRYTFVFGMDELTIKHGARECAAVWSDNTDPQWSGEPIVGTMQNDSIYPPEGLESLIEHLWRGWRDGQLDAQQLQTELNAFADYINASTHAKPDTDFWRGIF